MKLALNKLKLGALMLEKDLDEKKLAEQMGVSYIQVYRVLRGLRNPGNEFLAGLKSVAGEETALDELTVLMP